MEKENKLPEFRKNESFYIREGWISKAIICIAENPGINIFRKNDGIKFLGIGSNRVKGLHYWLLAADIIDAKNQLTEFGNILLDNDRYLENTSSWFLIHRKLVKNKQKCPVFNWVFSSDFNSFRESEIEDSIISFYKDEVDSSKLSAFKTGVNKDVNVFVRSYYTDNPNANPEDNYVCPLSALKLFTKNKDGIIKKQSPSGNLLKWPVVAYCILQMSSIKKSNNVSTDSFDIDEAFENPNGPAKIFNLDKTKFHLYLDTLQKEKCLKIDRTAGLNAVYFESKLKGRKINDVYEWEAK